MYLPSASNALERISTVLGTLSNPRVSENSSSDILGPQEPELPVDESR